MAAPYETTFQDGEDLFFFAELPALSHIGSRFEELQSAWLNYQAPAEEIAEYRRLAALLQSWIDRIQAGEEGDWPEIRREIHAAHPTAAEAGEARVRPVVLEYFQTGQMPLAEFLDWQIDGVETAWSLLGGEGPDPTQRAARIDRLTARLRTGGYTTARDRQMQAEDPERYQFWSQSLNLMADTIDSEDPQAYPGMIAQLVENFKKTPAFAESQARMQEMEANVERYKDTHPEIYAMQKQQFESMQQFLENPAAAIAAMTANLPQPSEPEPEEPPSAAFTPSGSPQQWRFTLGKRKSPSKKQIASFEQLQKNQERLRPGIEAALRSMHGMMDEGPMRMPSERVFFPTDYARTDIPLQCFQVREVSLPADDGPVIFTLDSPFGHYDEHGCYLSISDGEVDRFGTWDEVLGGDDDWNGDE